MSVRFLLPALAAAVVSSAPLSAQLPSSNPFAAPSPLLYETPQFDRIKDADYLPAFEEGMKQQRAEIDAIADNPAPPTFENTILAVERSGQLLTRVARLSEHAEGGFVLGGEFISELPGAEMRFLLS